MYASFWDLIIAFLNGGQWAPFIKFAPPLAQTSSYATVLILCLNCHLYRLFALFLLYSEPLDML